MKFATRRELEIFVETQLRSANCSDEQAIKIVVTVAKKMISERFIEACILDELSRPIAMALYAIARYVNKLAGESDDNLPFSIGSVLMGGCVGIVSLAYNDELTNAIGDALNGKMICAIEIANDGTIYASKNEGFILDFKGHENEFRKDSREQKKALEAERKALLKARKALKRAAKSKSKSPMFTLSQGFVTVTHSGVKRPISERQAEMIHDMSDGGATNCTAEEMDDLLIAVPELAEFIVRPKN